MLISLKATEVKNVKYKPCALAVEEAAKISDMTCEEESVISVLKTHECKPNTCIYQHNR